MLSRVGAVVASVLVVAVVAAILLFGMWQFGWFVAKQNQNQQNQMNHNSQQFQDGLVSQERDRLTGYDEALDAGQKTNIKNMFCTAYLDLTLPPNDLAQAHAHLCN